MLPLNASDLVILGLLLDLAGAVTIGIPATRVSMWYGFKRLNDTKAKRRGMEKLQMSEELIPEDFGFRGVLSTISQNYGKSNLNGDPCEINLTDRWGVGRVVVVEYDDGDDTTNNELEVIGDASLVHNWVEQEIERTYLKIGVLLLTVGFGLQILYQVL